MLAKELPLAGVPKLPRSRGFAMRIRQHPSLTAALVVLERLTSIGSLTLPPAADHGYRTAHRYLDLGPTRALESIAGIAQHGHRLGP